jgi:DNA-binding transcriptional regulator YiaG
MSKAGSRILNSVRKARAFARTDALEGFAVHAPEAIDVTAIRGKLGLRRERFAVRFGSVRPPCRIGSRGDGSRNRQRGRR